MTTQAVFESLQSTGLANFLGHQNHWFGALAQLLHIAGLISLLSGILLVSLRLLGVGLREQSPRLLARAATPLIWGGAALLFISGAFIFLPSAGIYDKPAVWIKLALILAALLVHFTLYRKATSTDTPNPVLARSTAVLTIVLWFSVGFAGRAIGFT